MYAYNNLSEGIYIYNNICIYIIIVYFIILCYVILYYAII